MPSKIATIKKQILADAKRHEGLNLHKKCKTKGCGIYDCGKCRVYGEKGACMFHTNEINMQKEIANAGNPYYQKALSILAEQQEGGEDGVS